VETGIKRLEIGNDKRRYALMLAISMVFVLGGSVMLVGTRDSEQLLQLGASTAFFALCAAVFIYQLADKRPRIVIDDSGIYDRTLKLGTIPWDDIEGAFVQRVEKQAFICLRLKDEAKYIGKLTGPMKLLVKGNQAMDFTAVSLNLSGVKARPEDICNLILYRLADTH